MDRLCRFVCRLCLLSFSPRCLEGYRMYTLPRTESRGDGVACFVKQGIEVLDRQASSHSCRRARYLIIYVFIFLPSPPPPPPSFYRSRLTWFSTARLSLAACFIVDVIFGEGPYLTLWRGSLCFRLLCSTSRRSLPSNRAILLRRAISPRRTLSSHLAVSGLNKKKE